jgi:hypothetical protein
MNDMGNVSGRGRGWVRIDKPVNSILNLNLLSQKFLYLIFTQPLKGGHFPKQSQSLNTYHNNFVFVTIELL